MMIVSVWLSSDNAECWNISPRQFDRLSKLLPEAYLYKADTEEELLALLPGSETVVSWSFEQEWLERAPKLRYLVTPAAGLDYFDIDPPPEVTVVNSSFHGPIIAETVIGMMLDHSRRIGEAAASMHGEQWPRYRLAGRQSRLMGSRVTIAGFGNIGSHVGRLAKYFCCGITGIRRTQIDRPSCFGPDDRILPPEKLRDVLPETDHLVLALPRSRKTDQFIGSVELSLLPEHAAVYNVGRGNAIDERALTKGLETGRPGAAYLDVFEQEPLPVDSPLRELPNCRLMPHISASTPDYLDMFIDEFVPRFRAWHRM